MLGHLLDGRYKVIQELAAGGFSQTYLAEDTRLPDNPKCVVKHLNPTIKDPIFAQKALELFKAEAKTLQNLGRHDRIPQLYAYFEENSESYLVQEFIAGHPLSEELIPCGQLPEARVVKLIQEVLEILEFVHSFGVIHRDIKPSNLIRRHRDGKLVLIDFGTVKQIPMQMSVSPLDSQVTLPMGTPGYMSSEQERGDSSPNSDIYALGMVALQALTGKHPSQFQRLASGEVVWRDRIKVSDAFAAILNKMISIDPGQRYQTPVDVLQALKELSHNHAKLDAIATKPQQEGQPIPLWLVLTGTGVAAIAAVNFSKFASLLPLEPKISVQSTQSTERLAAPVLTKETASYDKLHDYLKRKDWRAADAETYAILLKAAGSRSYANGTFNLDEIGNLSFCAAVPYVDRLWSEASNGRLGFTAQKKIFETYGKDWQAMYEKVRWRTLAGKWLVDTRYNRETKRWEYAEGRLPNFQNPPQGHLPVGIREAGRQSMSRNALLQKCL